MFKYLFFLFCTHSVVGQPVVRLNHVGFLPPETKTAVVLSKVPLVASSFSVFDQQRNHEVFRGALERGPAGYGQFPYSYSANFSAIKNEGTYSIRVDSVFRSFRILENAYRTYLHYPMQYLWQQRCGSNPVFDTVCHQNDGIAVDGPDEGTRIDVTGGYHDASDYLRFLITTSYTAGSLLLAYKEFPKVWPDDVDSRGKKRKNGIPDILDEARWGIEWMMKLTPGKDKLYHQVADDRDHSFWDLPYRDDTDYGWGKGKERPVYFATGSPQGIFQYKNASTGVSNIAGRTAAVFALASVIWRESFSDTGFAGLLRRKAEDLYLLGTVTQGFSESVPCKAPYRFHEKTFYDDLEWAAVELFRATKSKRYLQAALRFAQLASDTSWANKDSTHHYEYFPYVNLAHYELFEFSDASTKRRLIDYYRSGLISVRRRAAGNAFAYGVPRIWVSNNLATGILTQAILLKKMTGSNEFDDVITQTRDWLFGRNPWGQSFVIGVPEEGPYPQDPHSVVGKELGLRLTGALVDGPVTGSIFGNLKGLRLLEPDEFGEFQSTEMVYHDDIGDYSTNEPTLDGTASLLFILGFFSAQR